MRLDIKISWNILPSLDFLIFMFNSFKLIIINGYIPLVSKAFASNAGVPVVQTPNASQ